MYYIIQKYIMQLTHYLITRFNIVQSWYFSCAEKGRNVKFVHIDTILANYRNEGASVKAEVLSMNEANQIKKMYNIGIEKRTILKNKLKSAIIYRLFHR